MIKKIFPVVFLVLSIIACSSDDNTITTPPNEGGNDVVFSRASMLRNFADNIIIPSYQELSDNLDALEIAKDGFIAAPSQPTLDNFRAAWLTAYKSWQRVEIFDIGKAEEIQLNFQMNIYPVNTADVEANVSAGFYDLSSPNNHDAIGFPALDYLLYGVGATDIEIIEKYDTDPQAENYKDYLSAVTNRMKFITQLVLSDWIVNYQNVFAASTENNASSAANKIVNDFIFYYEKGLRANKIGIPAGNFSSTPLPDRVEAFYNQEISKELALDALNAVQNMFNGISTVDNAEGQGFKTYLQSLDREDLADLINEKFNAAREKMQLLDANFTTQINTDNTKMTEAYDALQAAVVLLKVDMLQAFNIAVDYVDADGD
ncbi:imelysin family protein [Kordia jejudonensis]|uniref:imelysin family protein n=1 Tax=Kordia jejudonensis TaxID=1348245 RepID=UPI00069AC870|nr:imelysin family protein [Kordia jejudonensis]